MAPSDRDERHRGVGWWLVPALLGTLALACLLALGSTFFGGFALDLSTVDLPHPRQVNFLMYWSSLGAIAALALTVSLARLAATPRGYASLRRAWNAADDNAWIALASLLAFVIPLVVRYGVTQEASLTDDEACYLFSARLLASGRLWVASHPMREFFRHDFMVVDGRYFSQYFLGWPALLAPGVLVGRPDLVNPLLAALTVPAIAFTAKRLAGSMAARMAALIFVTSPALMVAPATLMSNTSCLCALSWLALCALRSRDDEAPLWSHATVGALAGVAFFIRPTAAASVGLPVLVWWASGVRSHPAPARALAAFAAPSLALAALFLTVNKLQTGSMTTVAYQHAARVFRESGSQLTIVWAGDRQRYLRDAAVVHFMFERSATDALAWLTAGLFRFQAAVLGWPCAWLLLPLAPRGATRRLLLAMIGLYAAVHLGVLDPGVEYFGPHHFFELALPFVLLTVMGAAALHRWSRGVGAGAAGPARRAIGFAAPAMVVVMASLSAGIHLPLRLVGIRRVAADARAPLEAVERANLRRAVVFAQVPFHPPMQCYQGRERHLVLWHPLNHPDLGDTVLWVNHVDVASDQRFLATLPGRRGYVLHWSRECVLTLSLLP